MTEPKISSDKVNQTLDKIEAARMKYIGNVHPAKTALALAACAIGLILLGALFFAWEEGPDTRNLASSWLTYDASSQNQRRVLVNCVNARFNLDDQYNPECLLDAILKELDQSQKEAFYMNCVALCEPVTFQEISNIVQKQGFPQSEADRYLELARRPALAGISWSFWTEVRFQCRRVH